MLVFTYKHVVITIISLFVCTSALLLLSHNSFAWYVYMFPCVLTYFILVNRTNKVKVYQEQLLIENIFKRVFYKYEDIQKISVFKDFFFYVKTIGIRIHFKNGICKKYYIGTLLTSQILELSNILNNKLKEFN